MISSYDTADEIDERPKFMRRRRDPGVFLLPMIIRGYFTRYRIVDTGTETSSISVTVVRKMGLGDLVTCRHEMTMRDGVYFRDIRQISELPVKIGKLRFHIDFLVMRGIGKEELTTPIVLGRIFLAQCSAEIDYRMMRLIISSRFESEMRNLQHVELELRHRGMVRPICEEVSQGSRVSGSYISEEKSKDTEEDPEEDPN